VQIASVEKRHFVGLPIPAAADVIAATILLYFWLGGEGESAKHVTMLLVIFVVAGLMVSEIKYYSFKDIRFYHRHPFSALLGVLAVGYLTVGAPQFMLFLGTVGYAASGPLTLFFRWVSGRRAPPAGEQTPARAALLDKPGAHR
jgi:CDP-diacylglycerol--serine O-phosphatidyltransferase